MISSELEAPSHITLPSFLKLSQVRVLLFAASQEKETPLFSKIDRRLVVFVVNTLYTRFANWSLVSYMIRGSNCRVLMG
jgi:hypothetical protein